MPIFHFVLNSGWDQYRDIEGEEFVDADAARAHARVIARELMRNGDMKTRSWRVEVRNEQNARVDEVTFVSFDERLIELPPAARAQIERLYESNASLNQAIGDLRNSLRQVKATLARANGAPFLAAVNGEQL